MYTYCLCKIWQTGQIQRVSVVFEGRYCRFWLRPDGNTGREAVTMLYNMDGLTSDGRINCRELVFLPGPKNRCELFIFFDNISFMSQSTLHYANLKMGLQDI